jgi:hypothetical protein
MGPFGALRCDTTTVTEEFFICSSSSSTRWEWKAELLATPRGAEGKYHWKLLRYCGEVYELSLCLHHVLSSTSSFPPFSDRSDTAELMLTVYLLILQALDAPDLCDHFFLDLTDWGLGISVSVWSLSIRQAL